MRVVLMAVLTLGLAFGTALAQSGRAGSGTAAPASPGGPALAPSPKSAASEPDAKERIADCVRLWDSGTHMSKQEWRRACERTMNRIENLTANAPTPGPTRQKR
jgi:hypothetical protein